MSEGKEEGEKGEKLIFLFWDLRCATPKTPTMNLKSIAVQFIQSNFAFAHFKTN